MIAITRQSLQKTLHPLFRTRTRLNKRLKIVNDPERRDWFKGGYGVKHRKIAENESKYLRRSEFKPLSKAESLNERYPVLNFDKKTFNKEFKKGLNQSINESVKQVVMAEVNNPKKLMSPEAYKINKINALEWEKFRRSFYEKNELKRLLEKKDKDQDEILQGHYAYNANSPFVEQMFDKVKIYNAEGGTGKEQVHKAMNVKMFPFQNYQAELKSIKNDRIDGIIGMHNSNEKLKQLMECGFMDKSKSISDVFELLRKTHQIGEAEGSNEGDQNIEYQTIHNSNQYASEKEAATNSGDEATSQNAGDLARTESGTLSHLLKTRNPSILPKERSEELRKEFRYMTQGDPKTATAMELVVDSVDKGLEGTPSTQDFVGLMNFVSDFLTVPSEDRQNVLERVDRLKAIREYEESVLAQREMNMLEKRGRPTFQKLTPIERIAFVKHSLNSYNEVLSLLKDQDEIVKNDPALVIAMEEKLALMVSLGDMFYKNHEHVDLHTVAHPEYKNLLALLNKQIPQLEFDKFARTVFSIGMLHKREVGKLTNPLYRNTLRTCLLAMDKHMTKYLQLIDNPPADRDEQQYPVSVMMYNYGIAIEGMIKVGSINNTTPLVLIDKMMRVVENGATYITEGCTVNRMLAFLVQVTRQFDLAVCDKTMPIINTVLQRVIHDGIVQRMTRPDVEDFLINLIAVQTLKPADKKELAMCANLVKTQLLLPDNIKFLQLPRINELLILLVGTNTMDKASKAIIKRKVRDEIIAPENLVSYVIPQTMENLAVSDLKDSNPFYSEYSSPLDLLLLKSFFGIRAYEADNTPRFDLYRDMYKLATSHTDKLSQKDLLRIIDTLCTLEISMETFHLSMLEKTVQDMQFDMQIGARMCLLYSILGIDNMRDKWANLCLQKAEEGKETRTDSLIDVLIAMDKHQIEIMSQSKFEQIIDWVVSKVNLLSSTRKVMLAWTFCRLGVDISILSDIIRDIDTSSLRTLDKVILSQIPFEQDVARKLIFKEQDLLQFYKQIFNKNSNFVENDTEGLYSKVIKTLEEAGNMYRTNFLLRTKQGCTVYVPLYINKLRRAVYIYSEDLFLNDLSISSRRDAGFNYYLQPTDRLPQFFERQEELLQEEGVKIDRLNALQVRKSLGIRLKEIEQDPEEDEEPEDEHEEEQLNRVRRAPGERKARNSRPEAEDAGLEEEHKQERKLTERRKSVKNNKEEQEKEEVVKPKRSYRKNSSTSST